MSEVKFNFLVSLFNGIARHARTETKRDREQRPALDKFIKWSARFKERYPDPPNGTTAILFRLLFPEFDPERKYHMQELRLGQQVAIALGRRDDTFANWSSSGSSGCLGLEVKREMTLPSSQAPADKDEMTIHDISDFLDKLATCSPYTSEAIRRLNPTKVQRKHLMRNMYNKLNPDAAAYLTEIILKDLSYILYRVPEGTHWEDALEKYNTRSFYVLTIYDAMSAWDPSGRLWRLYKCRANLTAACNAWEAGVQATSPQLHVPIAIPKSVKGLSLQYAMSRFNQAESTVWAEVKYDGERAQIHVECVPNGQPKITIYSKSHRDSTKDRQYVHPLILRALFDKTAPCRVQQNVILDAEMVAFDRNTERIDEFWRIRCLVESTAVGVRNKQRPDERSQDNEYYNASLSSDTDGGHLALVFFDVLYLDGASLVDKPYSQRRTILESLLLFEPGSCMLSARFAIDMSSKVKAEDELAWHCARAFARFEEGLVLKVDNGRYNDPRGSPWVKMKKDYIPGLGDTLDVVFLGAGWQKKRAAGLHVTTDVWTTFYFGVVTNMNEIKKDPTVRPSFEIYFTSEYGDAVLRKGLHHLNFWLRCTDHTPYETVLKKGQKLLSYDFKLFPNVPPPRVMVNVPLLAEIYGAGFTVPRGSQRYEPRHPRITLVYPRSEKSWMEGVTNEQLDKIARAACGKEDQCQEAVDKLWANEKGPAYAGGLRGAKATAQRAGKFYTLLSKKAASRKRLRCVLDEIEMEKQVQEDERRFMSIGNLPAPQQVGEQLMAPASTPRKRRKPNAIFTVEQVACSSLFHFYRKCARESVWAESFPRHGRSRDLGSFLQGCGWIDDSISSWDGLKRGIVIAREEDMQDVKMDVQRLGSAAIRDCSARVPVWVLPVDGGGGTIGLETDVRRRTVAILE
ncbi:hypothetical protein CYLTODRAFT_371177 [Cylindrobasidium torrendii FP15055 ss-10]|uniref:ATP-dependent DNA ligase family profile domain-containing protein n=1 Tax=Cylindrobasidium torrendii FP15055 ss-10 TaxID=1314674 RepID=A0A0D7BJ83_9AGAR|nr:hypothetical protein CYLTODRAFT_371177 [Cylindrobasidium torrendii FP15055 ss-10]